MTSGSALSFGVSEFEVLLTAEFPFESEFVFEPETVLLEFVRLESAAFVVLELFAAGLSFGNSAVAQAEKANTAAQRAESPSLFSFT